MIFYHFFFLLLLLFLCFSFSFSFRTTARFLFCTCQNERLVLFLMFHVSHRVFNMFWYWLFSCRVAQLTDLYCRVDSWLRDNELMQSLWRADLFGEDEHDIHFDNPTPSVVWSESSRSSSTTGTGGPLCQPRPPSDSAAAPSNFVLPSSNSNCFLSVDSGTPSTLVPSSTSSALALQRSSSSHAHDVLRDVEHSAVFVPVFCP